MTARSLLRWTVILDIAALIAVGLIPAFAIAALLALRAADRQLAPRQASPIHDFSRVDFDHAHRVFDPAKACGGDTPGAARPCPSKAAGPDAGQRPAVSAK